jgi:hypothetical protein
LQNPPATDWPAWVTAEAKFLSPEISIPASACVRTHRYRLGQHRLVAFERNVDYHMSEDLKQAGGNERLEKPIEIEAGLATPKHVYDLRAGKYLGRTDKIRFTLDPWQPSLFALTEQRLQTDNVVQELAEQR